MGLDNGIILNVNPNTITNLNKLVQLDKTWGEDPHTEVCYWRKCWGIRNAIVEKLHFNDNEESKLDVEDIPVIIKILFDFYGQTEWEEDADSIWEWDEFKDTLRQQIFNLMWLYDYMLKHSNAEVIFYDSY